MERRLSHAEHRIQELEETVKGLELEKSRMAIRIVELEAALIRMESNNLSRQSTWSLW